jgi:hypothetical protein
MDSGSSVHRARPYSSPQGPGALPDMLQAARATTAITTAPGTRCASLVEKDAAPTSGTDCQKAPKCANCYGPYPASHEKCPARPVQKDNRFIPPTKNQLRRIRHAGLAAGKAKDSQPPEPRPSSRVSQASTATAGTITVGELHRLPRASKKRTTIPQWKTTRPWWRTRFRRRV